MSQSSGWKSFYPENKVMTSFCRLVAYQVSMEQTISVIRVEKLVLNMRFMMPHSLVRVFQSFVGEYYLHLQYCSAVVL
jgi:hypothetical protein